MVSLEAEQDSIKVEDEKNISDYIKIKTQITNLSKDFLRYLTIPHYIIPFMNSGRLLKVRLVFLKTLLKH